MPGKNIHYAWLVLVSCLGFYSLIYGVLNTTMGVFFAPVMEETGWSRTMATSFTYVQPLVSAVCAVPAAKIFERFSPRVVLSICVLAHGIAYVLPAVYNALWVWILYGVVLGVFASFALFLAVPSLVNAWFKKRVGFAIGFASAGISVFAALSNPVLSAMIGSMGWHAARIIAGVVVTAVAFVLTAVFVRRSPEEMGMRPYGYEERTAQDIPANTALDGVPASRALKSSAFVCLMLSIAFLNMCTGLGQQLASYGAQGPLGAATGAMGISIVSTVAIFSKIALGWSADRFGVRPTVRASCVTGVVGPLLMGFCGSNTTMFFAGAAVFGIGYSTMTVMGPLAVRDAFGTADYTKIYARITSLVFVFSALGGFAYAAIYDLTGSYTGMFIMPALLYAVCFVIMPLGVRAGKKLWTGKTVLSE